MPSDYTPPSSSGIIFKTRPRTSPPGGRLAGRVVEAASTIDCRLLGAKAKRLVAQAKGVIAEENNNIGPEAPFIGRFSLRFACALLSHSA